MSALLLAELIGNRNTCSQNCCCDHRILHAARILTINLPGWYVKAPLVGSVIYGAIIRWGVQYHLIILTSFYKLHTLLLRAGNGNNPSRSFAVPGDDLLLVWLPTQRSWHSWSCPSLKYDLCIGNLTTIQEKTSVIVELQSLRRVVTSSW